MTARAARREGHRGMDSRGVIRSAGTVGALTGVSRVLGLARDVLMAGMFGTSSAMSAFVVAFRLPNLFRALFGEGALSAAFVPVFVETLRRDGREAAWRVARQVFTLTALVLAALTLAGLAGVRWGLARPDLAERTRLVLSLLQIMLPYMIFICLAALAMASLNALHHFAVPAAAPSLLNLCLIAAVLFVCPRLGEDPSARIAGVAWAVLAAGALQLAVQLPLLARRGMRLRPLFDLSDRRLWRIVSLMGPAALGRAVTQFNVLLDSLLAVWIGAWAPAALFFSERLIYLPLGLFATALGTVLLPVFSGQAARADPAAMRRTLNHSLRLLLFVMIPAAAGLLALGVPLVELLFQRRAFGAESAVLTARALAFYAPGLVVFSLAKVFVPAFFALQDTRTPVRVGLVIVSANIALSILFMLTWPLSYRHAGIAFATVLAGTAQVLALGVLLHRRVGSPGWRAIGAGAARAAAAAAVMAFAARWVVSAAALRLAAAGRTGTPARAAAVAAAMAAGLLVYAAAAALLRSPELRELGRALARRGGETRPAA